MKNQNHVHHLHDQLIPAKISLPPHRTGIIRRKLSFKKLDECFTHRMTLVSAPAGYGKTTLISDWSAAQRCPVAWISLTKDDNQLPTFLSYVSAALKQVDSTAGKSIEEAFHQQQALDLPAIMVPLLHDLDQVTPAMIFVLDDYHLIENPQIHDLVQFLMQNCCSWSDPNSARLHGCHPILITRHDPPFPIAKWRIDQEIIEIRADDLKFSLEETGKFLKNAYKPDIEPKTIDRIAALTEGWVTGLQLSVLSMNTPGQKKKLVEIDASNQLLVDYLMEEVIQNLPQEVQRFLLQTSILEHMTSELCDQIRDAHDSQEILEWLVRENLFILPMDNRQGWYRYHQLFLDVLVHRQYLLSQSTLQEYHSRAAGWLERKGYYQASLLHWLAAGNIDNAARMLEEAAPALLNSSQMITLRQLCEAFPEDAIHQYPWLTIYRAWSYVIIREDAIDYWLDQAMEVTESENCNQNFSSAEIGEMQGNIFAIRALHEARFGPLEKTMAYANQALSLLPANALNVKGLVLIAIAKTYLRTGDLSRATSNFLQARTILQEGGNLSGLSEAVYLAGRIFHLKGKLKAAYQYYNEAVARLIAQPEKEYYYAYLSYACLGLIELEWNHLDLAEEYFQKAYTKRNILGTTDRAIDLSARLQGYLKENRLEEAGNVVEEAEPYLEYPLVSEDTKSELIGTLLVYYSLHHDPEIARQIIEEHQLESISPEDFHRVSELVGLAHFYWKTGEFQKLRGLMETLLPRLESSGRIDLFIQLQTLYAVASFQANEIDNSIHYFISALNHGLREGYFWTYVEFGEPMIQLIFALANSEEISQSDPFDSAFLQEISAVISQRIIEKKYHHNHPQNEKPRRAIHLENMADPLTAQEKLVLRYLAGGNDNQSIAKELRVSNNTIKTHLANIYSKLGVHNRMEAVNKAKVLDLL